MVLWNYKPLTLLVASALLLPAGQVMGQNAQLPGLNGIVGTGTTPAPATRGQVPLYSNGQVVSGQPVNGQAIGQPVQPAAYNSQPQNQYSQVGDPYTSRLASFFGGYDVAQAQMVTPNFESTYVPGIPGTTYVPGTGYVPNGEYIPGGVPGGIPGGEYCGDFCGEPCIPCEPPRRRFCFRGYGEYLYLTPTDGANIAYTVNSNNVPPALIDPVSPFATLQPSYDSGYRLGFGVGCLPTGEFGAMYTYFGTETSGSAAANAPAVLRSLVSHPSTLNAASVFDTANASSTIEFQLIDLDYRRAFFDSRAFTLIYMMGARYATLEQGFNSTFTGTYVETVNTNIDFEGGGVRVGLEGEWKSERTGFLLYSKGYASLLNGEFTSAYLQNHSINGVQVNTAYSETRIVPILDLELGFGWRSRNDRFSISAGYLFNSWFNMVTTREWIEAVQTAGVNNMSDTVVFSGATVRAELRY